MLVIECLEESDDVFGDGEFESPFFVIEAGLDHWY
jgi:hypothetical protein